MLLFLLALLLTSAHLCASSTIKMSSRSTLIVGLNPALQRTVTLSASLQVGSVNRGASVQVGIGGKGQDVFVAGASMRASPPPLLLQFLGGGAEGDALAALLQQMSPESPSTANAASLSVRTAAACRTCVTLVDPVKGEATEIVEPSGAILPSEITLLLSSLETRFLSEKARGVAVMGSMPPGCGVGLYSEILLRVCDRDTKVLFDTATGIFESLEVCNQLQCDAVIKLNARELCKLAGVDTNTHGGEASSATSPSLILEACTRLAGIINPTGAEGQSAVYVAVTDGPYPSSLIQLSSARPGSRLMVPPLPRPMVNPIGAGDAVSSGTLLSWCGAVALPSPGPGSDKWASIFSSFSWGLACGAASCMGGSNSVFELGEAEGLYGGIRSEPY